MARVPLHDAADLPEEYRYLFTETEVGDRNISKAMANSPKLLQWYMRYSSRLWEVLPEREREVVILAVARALEHPYEWHQHVRLGRAAGINDEEIYAISRADHGDLDEREGALAAYARALALDDLRDADHERLSAHVDDETLVGIAMLVSHYVATARTLSALGVETEEAFVGWLP